MRTDDFVIAVAYFSITIQILMSLFHYPRLTSMPTTILILFILFALLIFLCGVGHALRCFEVVTTTTTHVTYAVVNAITAVISLSTAIYLFPLIPNLMTTLDDGIQTLLILNQEAVDSKRQLLTFMSFLCHEMRNPLFAITSTLTFLADDVEDFTDDQAKAIASIEQSTKLMMRLVNDVLDLRKIESGKLELESRLFNIHELLSHVASSTEIQLHKQQKNQRNVVNRKKEVKFLYTFAPSVPRIIRGDSVRILQIVYNLLSNACKFTEQGSIQLSISSVDYQYAIASGLIPKPPQSNNDSPTFNSTTQLQTNRFVGGRSARCNEGIRSFPGSFPWRSSSTGTSEHKPQINPMLTTSTMNSTKFQSEGKLFPTSSTALLSKSVDGNSTRASFASAASEDDTKSLYYHHKVEPNIATQDIQIVMEEGHTGLTKSLLSSSSLSEFLGLNQDVPSDGECEHVSNHNRNGSSPIESKSANRYITSDDDTVVLRVEVSDTGPGIPSERMGVIFEPYTQSKLSDYRKHGGTGLGLSILLRLLRQMGGDICAASEVGVGSTFIAYLPVHVPRSEETIGLELETSLREAQLSDLLALDIPSDLMEDVLSSHRLSTGSLEEMSRGVISPPPNELGNGSKPLQRTTSQKNLNLLQSSSPADPVKKPVANPPRLEKFHFPSKDAVVLVVDDNNVNRRLIGRMLTHFNLEYHQASDGQEAIDAVLKSRNLQPSDVTAPRYSLILMDMCMPVLGGVDATRILRREYSCTIPIVALTANAADEFKHEALEAGCTDFIAKPILRDHLYQTCLRFLGSSGSHLSVREPGQAALNSALKDPA